MKVKELIKELYNQDPEAEVGIVYDGADRMDVTHIWLSRENRVLLSDGGVVYETEDRPVNAPTTEEDRYWDSSNIGE